MNISHHHSIGNSSRVVPAASDTNQSKYLTPDYFLAASQSDSYYGKKYATNTINRHHTANTIAGIEPHRQSKCRKIWRVASVMLLSLGFFATSVKVDASPSHDFDPALSTTSYTGQNSQQQPKKKPLISRAAHKVAKRLGFSSNTSFAKNLKSLSQNHPEISLAELKELYAREYGESMDATISRGRDKLSGLAEALKKSLALREKTLERRKAEAIFTSEDIEDIYSRPLDAISISSSSSTEYSEPWQDPDVIIREAFTSEFRDIKQIEPSAPALEFSQTKQVEPSAPQLSASNSIEELKSQDLSLLSNEESKAIELIDQAVEDSGYSSPSSSSSLSVASSPTNEEGFQGGYETDISNCAFDDTNSTEYDTEAEIRAYENVPVKARNKRYIKQKGSRYSYRDIDQGLTNLKEDSELSEVESEQWDDEWSNTAENSDSDIEGYNTVYTSSSSDDSDNSSDEDDLPLPPPPTAEELAELTKESDTLTQSGLIAVELVGEEEQQADTSSARSTHPTNINNSNQEVSEEEEDTSDSFDTEESDMSSTASTDSIHGADMQVSNISQAELLKKAETTAARHAQAREASKIASRHIKHRIFARDMVTAAVAAGDDADDVAEKTSSYSIWSSGTLGSNKQKSKADLNGYSSKIAGGTIGLELNLENDQLLGSSFSKFTSRVKYQDQGGSSDLRSSTASNRAKYDTHIFSLYGLSPVSRNMSVSVIGSAGLSKGRKARSKLLSFEPHLNYRVELPKAVTLIPHIGLRYEYEKANAYQEQIASNLSIESAKKSYQALSGEIGSRVIFAPIKLNGSTPRAISITPTVHFSVERKIGSRGTSHPFTLTYYESKQTIGTGTISANAQNERTSLNAGVGLIAASQNIKLELLYDQQRQRRFKSHQGVLKLKVSL